MSTLVIFDVDGTLLDTRWTCVPAFRGLFAWIERETGVAVPEDEAYIMSFVGKPDAEIWGAITGRDDPALLGRLAHVCAAWEASLLASGMGRLFPGVKEGLLRLAASHRLAIATNGVRRYADAFCQGFGLDGLFAEIGTADRLAPGESKADTVRRILAREKPERAVMVGDRSSDADAARRASLPFVGCLYGFGGPGELEGARALARTFDEVLDAVQRLLGV